MVHTRTLIMMALALVFVFLYNVLMTSAPTLALIFRYGSVILTITAFVSDWRVMLGKND